MALTVGTILGLLSGYFFRLHKTNTKTAAGRILGMTAGLFVLMTAAYYYLKQDPFDYLFGIERFVRDWDAVYGSGSEAFGPNELDWGPEEDHFKIAVGLNLGRYILGYLAFIGTGFFIHSVLSLSAEKPSEKITVRYPNGKIKEKGQKKYGFKDGIWEYYDENGRLAERLLYQEGELIEKITPDKNCI